MNQEGKGKVRRPVVAGKFYGKGKEDLIEQIENCYLSPYGPGDLPELGTGKELKGALGLIVPHAGYPASGPVAASGFRWLAQKGRPEVVVIVGTNHTGMGPPVAISSQGKWSTPLGSAEIETDLAEELKEGCEKLVEDDRAFAREHSIEVELPFLQYSFGEDLRFVPICVGSREREEVEGLGRSLARLLPREGVGLIASSDFTHYEPYEVARARDREALDAIVDLDLSLFYERVRAKKMSICGVGPIGALLAFSRERGLEAEELNYCTSGDTTGRKDQVVGYAAVKFE